MQTGREKRDVLGIPISCLGLDGILEEYEANRGREAITVTFVNPHACYLSNRESDYVHLLRQFDYVGCDGIGMVVAARLHGCKGLQRYSFDLTSFAPAVFDWARKVNASVGIVGGVNGVAQAASRTLSDLFPGLRIEAVFEGFDNQPDKAFDFILENEIELVICGMGIPQQERFVTRLANSQWRGLAFTCGGFLDQIAKGGQYYPKWVDKAEIRFLYRLMSEPRRLWRRYLIEYQTFIWRLFKSFFQRAN